MEQKSLKQLIDTDYRAYSMYVIEGRAIPSVIDGLKPVQRKLLYAMLNEHGGKKTKVADLGGISKFNYHHGEASAIGAAVGMSQDWNNNAPLFQGHGNFGSRIIQESAAPRYIYASLSDAYKKYFGDEEVCPKNSDIENPEPQHYLPIIPWALVNGVKGIAVGYATEILPRSPVALKTACMTYIKSKKAKCPEPSFPHFRGSVSKIQDSQWCVTGIVSNQGNKYIIEELPVGNDREGYLNFLNDLYDENKIQDYTDECSESGFRFVVTVNRAQKSIIETKSPYKFFKLEKTFTENITTLDEHGKLKLFDTADDVIKYFCDYRLTKYSDKIEYMKVKLSSKIKFNEDKKKFIQLVIDDKVDFKKVTRQGLVDFIQTNVTTEEYGSKFVSIPLYECTSDLVAQLSKSIKEIKEELKYWETTTPNKEYENALLS